jgi:hypothetical protein
MIIAAMTDLSLGDYGIIGLVLLAVFGMLKTQMSFSNKMAAEHAKQRERDTATQAKQREDDLDKISAALIIIQEQGREVVATAREVSANQAILAQNQELLAKDLTLVRDIVIQKLPDIKQS